MNSNISLPGLEGVIVTKSFEQDGNYQLHVELERVPHHCPSCNQVTEKVHDYRIQKVQHHHIFGRQTTLFYRK
ncbi:zinc-finger of transposase IS204/IS1001/IS1096/IS1165, partial [Gracilibacillus ureilyticus]